MGVVLGYILWFKENLELEEFSKVFVKAGYWKMLMNN